MTTRKTAQRKYNYSLSQLIDRLCIVTLKSIKIAENKDNYEEEATEIVHDINLLMNDESAGQLIRAIQINAIANESIWANESQARQGGDEQGTRLLFTHSLNSVRNAAMNKISSITGGRKDLKLDYMSPELTKKFGYNFDKVL